MFKTILLLDLSLFIIRRFLYTKLHIKCKDVFLTVLLIQGTLALTKAVVSYIKLHRKNSVKKPSNNEKVEESKYPYLRVVK